MIGNLSILFTCVIIIRILSDIHPIVSDANRDNVKAKKPISDKVLLSKFATLWCTRKTHPKILSALKRSSRYFLWEFCSLFEERELHFLKQQHNPPSVKTLNLKPNKRKLRVENISSKFPRGKTFWKKNPTRKILLKSSKTWF